MTMKLIFSLKIYGLVILNKVEFVEQKLLDLLSDALDVPLEALNIDSSSRTIENWDSLKHMSVIFAVEDKFNITIPDEKLSETTSVKSLLKIIQQC